MKSLQHVLWRGALALSLMAVGIGSGIGMPPAETGNYKADCEARTRILIATDAEVLHADAALADLHVEIRRPASAS